MAQLLILLNIFISLSWANPKIENFNLKEKILAEGQLIESDHFIFKLIDQIYSLKDLKLLYQTLNTFNCIYPDSYFLTNVRIDFKHFSKGLKTFEKGPYFGQQNFSPMEKNLFNKLMIAAKLMTYIEIQDIKLTTSLFETLKKSAVDYGCDLSFFMADNWFNNSFAKILKVEIFFRSRFKEESFIVTKEELSSYQKKSPELDLKELQALLRNRKIRKSVSILVNSIDKQVSHENFW